MKNLFGSAKQKKLLKKIIAVFAFVFLLSGFFLPSKTYAQGVCVYNQVWYKYIQYNGQNQRERVCGNELTYDQCQQCIPEDTPSRCKYVADTSRGQAITPGCFEMSENDSRNADLCSDRCKIGFTNIGQHIQDCTYIDDNVWVDCSAFYAAKGGTNAPEPPTGEGPPAGYQGPLPECAFKGTCRDVNEFLVLAINIGEILFSISGGIAFTVFIYGAFTLILSFGSSDKVRKSYSIIVAAVIGLIISFGAYLLVQFILDALQVSPDFRAIT